MRKWSGLLLITGLLGALLPSPSAMAHTAPATPVFTIHQNPGTGFNWQEPYFTVNVATRTHTFDIARNGCASSEVTYKYAAVIQRWLDSGGVATSAWILMRGAQNIEGTFACSGGNWREHVSATGPSVPANTAHAQIRICMSTQQTTPPAPTSDGECGSQWVKGFSASTKPPVSSTCVTSYTNPAGSYGDGVLATYFNWTGTTSGFYVHAPNPGDPPYPTATMTVPGEPLAGYTNKFGATKAITGLVASELRVSLKSDPTCFVVISIVGGTADPGAGDITDEDGTPCGINIFCIIIAALRKLFIPGQASSDAWTDFKNTALGRPPASLVAGGIQAVQFAQESATVALSNDAICSGGPVDGGPNLPSWCVQEILDVIDTGGNATWINLFRLFLKGFLWIFFAIILWRRSSAAFGSKPEGGEV